MTNHHGITIYYDGACPLCVKEISLLRRLDRPRDRLRFEDISPPDASPSCQIDRRDLMARFHVRLGDGKIVNGAQAFTESWSQIPYLIWLRPIGRWAPSRWALNKLYNGFLKIRPTLQKWVST
ncbi:MAG: DUF393 domain-containing protein [Pseudomonadota bacterium]